MTIYVTSNTTIGGRPLQAGSQYRLRGSEEDAVVAGGYGYYVEQPSHIPGLLVKENQVMGIVDADGRAMLYSQAVPVYAYTPRTVDGTATDAKNVAFLPGTGLATRTVEDKLRDVRHAKDFGVVANGSTDDTAALNAALAAGPGRVLLPTGTTRITGAISFVHAGTTLIGGGPDGTNIRLEGNAAKIQCISTSYCGITGIKISGQSKTAGESLLVQGSTQFLVRDVRMENAFNGMTFQSINSAMVDNFVITNCTGAWGIKFCGTADDRADILKIVNGQIGHSDNLTIDGILWGSYAHSMTLGNVRIIRGGRAIHALDDLASGVNFGRPSFLQASMLEIDFPALEGIKLVDFRDAWISNLYCHGSAAGVGIDIGANAYSVRILGGRVTSHWQHGMKIAGRFVQIAGTRIYGNGQAVDNTWDGISVEATADNVQLSGVQCGWDNEFGTRQRYGLNVVAGAEKVIYDPYCDFSGNMTAPVNGGGNREYMVANSSRHEFHNANGKHLEVGGSTAAVVNNLRIAGGAAGGDVALLAEGASTDIDMRLVPKGTNGRVQLGTWTSNADAAVNGYIEVKDDATGTVRKLATIA